MWPFSVVVANPRSDEPSGVSQGFKSCQPDAVFLEGSDEPFNQAVLLGGVGSDELLFDVVVLRCLRVELAREYQSVKHLGVSTEFCVSRGLFHEEFTSVLHSLHEAL